MAHPLAGGPAGDAWGTTPGQSNDPIPEIIQDALPALALQGRWREVASRCRAATATAHDTATAMSIAAYHLLALLKLNMLEEAASELAKLGAASWDTPLPPGTASTAAASAAAAAADVPFALRRIAAELPWWLGRQQEAIDRLYRLLGWCNAQEAQAAAADTGGSSTTGLEGRGSAGAGGAPGAAQALWRRRQRDVALLLVNKHCRGQQYGAALGLLGRQLARDPEDVGAWQEVGMVQALLGDTAAAAATLQRLERLLLETDSSSGSSSSGGGEGAGAGGGGGLEQQQRWRRQLVHRNRGLLCFLQHDYRGAAREYQAALELDPGDATAANNHALALMHCNQLQQAMAALEGAFRRAPLAMLQEPVATNLAAMLDLGASPGSLAAKQRMSAWVAAVAPDDFDMRLGA